MSELLATRCPLCKVAFYVTKAQLGAAQGKVRCGICLHIFNGNKHAISVGDETAQGANTGEPVDPGNDAVIDDNYDMASLFVQDSTPDNNHRAPAKVSSAQADTLAEGVGQDPESPPRNRPPVEHSAASQPNWPRSDTATQTVVGADNETPVLAIEHPSHQRLSLLADTWRAGQTSTANTFKPASSPAKFAVQLALIVMGIGALVIQLIYQASPQLSLDLRYRPALESICGTLGCAVTEQHDLSRIKSDRLVVQAHPDVDAALQVDLVLTNHAPFPQRFPDLRLQFTNLQGSILAQRQFKPKEYLQGTMANTPTMAAEKAYRITLDIVDPGPAATSFSLTVTN